MRTRILLIALFSILNLSCLQAVPLQTSDPSASQTANKLTQAISDKIRGFQLDYPVTKDVLTKAVPTGFIEQAIEDALETVLRRKSIVSINASASGQNPTVTIQLEDPSGSRLHDAPIFSDMLKGESPKMQLLMKLDQPDRTVDPYTQEVINMTLKDVFERPVKVIVPAMVPDIGINISDTNPSQGGQFGMSSQTFYTGDTEFRGGDLQKKSVWTTSDYTRAWGQVVQMLVLMGLDLRPELKITGGFEVMTIPMGSKDDNWYYQAYTVVSLTDPDSTAASKGHRFQLNVYQCQRMRKGQGNWLERLKKGGPDDKRLFDQITSRIIVRH